MDFLLGICSTITFIIGYITLRDAFEDVRLGFNPNFYLPGIVWTIFVTCVIIYFTRLVQ